MAKVFSFSVPDDKVHVIALLEEWSRRKELSQRIVALLEGVHSSGYYNFNKDDLTKYFVKLAELEKRIREIEEEYSQLLEIKEEVLQLKEELQRKLDEKIAEERSAKERELVNFLKSLFEDGQTLKFYSDGRRVEIFGVQIREHLKLRSEPKYLFEDVMRELSKLSEVKGVSIDELRELSRKHVDGFKELEELVKTAVLGDDR